MVDRWPLQPGNVDFSPAVPGRQGPRPASGFAQRVYSGAGHWAFQLESIPVFGDRIFTFRALRARSQGGVLPFMISPYDHQRSPATISGLLGSTTTYSDGSLHSDGTPFAASSPCASVVGGAAENALNLRIKLEHGLLDLRAGHYFGLGDGDDRRLYELGSVTIPDDSSVDDLGRPLERDLLFWPQLRAAAIDGDRVETEDPVTRCLINMEEVMMRLKLLRGRRGYVTIEGEEDKW